MARRAAKTKAPKAPKTPKVKKGKAKAVEADLEVIDDEDAAPGAGAGIEMGRVIVTLIALLISFALIYSEMQSSFGEGWPV